LRRSLCVAKIRACRCSPSHAPQFPGETGTV